MSGFQWGAKRAQFVSFKSFPFESDASQEWLNRLFLTAPADSVLPGGVAFMHRLDAAYYKADPYAWIDVVKNAPVDYIVRSADPTDEWQYLMQPQWCDATWCVYWAGRILLLESRQPPTETS